MISFTVQAQDQKKTNIRSIRKTNLTTGQKAPFSGVLLTRAALAKIISGYEERLKIAQVKLQKEKQARAAEVKHLKRTHRIQITSLKTQIKVISTGNNTVLKLYSKELDKCRQGPPWYTSPHFNFVLGTVFGGGVCAATCASFNAVK